MRKIHWIASYPKSGNTWVRMFLAAYRYGVSHINQAAELFQGDNNSYAYQAVSPKPITNLTRHEAMGLRIAALEHLIERHHSDPVPIKTHNVNAQINGIPLIWDEITAGGVYLVRDPRDVAVSYASHLGMDMDDVLAFMGNDASTTNLPGTEIMHFLASWSTHVRSWSNHDGITVVRYEDMLANPVDAFTAIVEALGYRVDADRVAEAVEHTSFNKLRDQEDAFGFAEASPKAKRFFRKGQAGGWRDVLTDEHVAKIQADHKEQMLAYDYALADTGVKHAS